MVTIFDLWTDIKITRHLEHELFVPVHLANAIELSQPQYLTFIKC